jgi:hypothetical protein
MQKLHWNDAEIIVEKISDMLREDTISAACFDADNKEIIWVESAERFLLLNHSNNTFSIETPGRIHELFSNISDEAIVECAENVGIIEIDEDGNITFTDDEEN